MNKIDLKELNTNDKERLLSKLDFEEKEITELPKSKSYLRKSFESLFSNPVAVASVIVLVIVILLIAFYFFVCPYNYKEIIEINGVRDITARNLHPFQYSKLEMQAIQNGQKIFPHIFGTDSICRDYFARTMMGTILSLGIGLVASTIVMVIGTIYGSIAGLLGGKVDLVMMRIVDVIYAIPEMLVIIIISVIFKELIPLKSHGAMNFFGPNILSMFVVYALLYWVSMARMVRGQILSIREKEYIVSLKIIQAKTSRIILKHIIPNCLSVIFIALALQIPSAIFTESYLSFVGLGVEEPLPSLGSLANNALTELGVNDYKLFFPSIMIIAIVLSFNLLGNAMRDAFDPKGKK